MSFGFQYTNSADPRQHKVFYMGGIDAKTIGNTTVFTTANDTRRFMVTQVILLWESVVGYISPPQVNVGQTGATYQDIVNAGGIVVGTTNTYLKQTFNASGPLTIAANTAVVCRVTSGGSGTTLTMACIVEGYYI